MTPYATLDDVDARYPNELIVLAADEQTGVRDDARITAGLRDASAEVRAILKGRYTLAQLGELDEDSLETLRIYAIDVALYRIALSFARSNTLIAERYAAAIKRLEAIAGGRGGLTFTVSSGAGAGNTPEPAGSGSPNEAIVTASERLFTRERMRGW